MPRREEFCQLGFSGEIEHYIESDYEFNKFRNYECRCGASIQAVRIGSRFLPISHLPWIH
jgi:hypothetical protein